MKEKVKRFKFERLRWEYVLTTPIFAVAIYFFFCAQNINELSISFVLVSAIILFLFALAAYVAIYLIVRRGFTAMLFCLFGWIGCYAEPMIWKLSCKIQTEAGLVFGLRETRHIRLMLNSLIVLAAAMLLTMLTHQIRQKEVFTKLAGGVILILLGINGVSILFSAFSGIKKGDGAFEIKTEFVQEDGIASPNIYWIHPDGMLGFDAVEKYYGDSQDALTVALAEKGFEISRSASFEAAHQTAISIPVLTSPLAYDTWISQYTVSHEEAMEMHNYNILMRMSLLREKAELSKAFHDKGYVIDTIAGLSYYYYPSEDGYAWGDGVWKYGKKSNVVLTMQRMLTNIAEINIYFSTCSYEIIKMMMKSPANYSDVSGYRAYMPEEEARAIIQEAYQYVDGGLYQDVLGLYDLLNGGYDSPRLTMIHDGIAHGPFRYNEDGSTHEESSDPLDYHAQHIYSGKMVLGMVDMIIEADPDAVIVIQADHGLHQNTEEDFKQAFGEEADAVEIWNSTISAVRIPEQYRNGEEHYMMDTPLNIARYLVNRFVGRNYEYLSGS